MPRCLPALPPACCACAAASLTWSASPRVSLHIYVSNSSWIALSGRKGRHRAHHVAARNRGNGVGVAAARWHRMRKICYCGLQQGRARLLGPTHYPSLSLQRDQNHPAVLQGELIAGVIQRHPGALEVCNIGAPPPPLPLPMRMTSGFRWPACTGASCPCAVLCAE